MRHLVLALVALLVPAGVSVGQKGTAEPDYYPAEYGGDVWTGIVTSVSEDTREFTLTYKKKGKEEAFVCVLPKDYKHKMVDGTYQEVKLDDLMGMTIRAYYISKTRKVNDQKVRYNDVFKIKILALAKPGP